MGGVNEGCFRENGTVRGIIHRSFYVDHGEDPRIKDLVIVDGKDLTERKDKLFQNSDCIIVMPGGVGTFNEFWDGVDSKSLNMKDMAKKCIVLVNIDGYYDGFIQQMERSFMDGILYHRVEDYFHVVSDVEQALQYCIEHFGQIQSAHMGHHNHEHISQARKSVREPSSLDEDTPIVSSKKVACSCPIVSVAQHAMIGVSLVALGFFLGMKFRH
jgi:hypothetical protein